MCASTAKHMHATTEIAQGVYASSGLLTFLAVSEGQVKPMLGGQSMNRDISHDCTAMQSRQPSKAVRKHRHMVRSDRTGA